MEAVSYYRLSKGNNNISFSSVANNSFLKKNLLLAAENGAMYSAGVSFLLSLFVRSPSILLTPKAKKRDKETACAKSIASSFCSLGIMAAVTVPLAKAVNEIEKNKSKYLSQDTLKFFSKNPKFFEFAKQSAKLGSSALHIYPKAFFTAAIIPPIIKYLFSPKSNEQTKNKKVTFKGGSDKKFLSKLIAKLYNNKKFQSFTQKFADTNFAQHIFCLIDVLSTGLFINQTYKNKKLEKERKKPLAINATLMTGTTIAGTYILDSITKKPMEKFTNDFIRINKQDPNLPKYLEGLKIIKPILILGGMYYILAPVISTFLTEKFTQARNHE